MLRSQKRQFLVAALFGLVATTSAIAAHNGVGDIERRQLPSLDLPGLPTSDSSVPPTTTEAPPSTSEQPSTTPSSTPPPVTTPSSTPSSSQSTPSETPSSTPEPSTSLEPLVSSQTVEFVTTVVTVSGGQTISIPITTKAVNEVTTGFATHTSTPGLNGGNNQADSGLSSKSKSIIGGVVGGVGGAILLAGIALVAWRLRKKRNQNIDDDDYLSGTTVAPMHDKRSSVGGNTPFQSNLESYHNPAGKVNTSANF